MDYAAIKAYIIGLVIDFHKKLRVHLILVELR